MRVAVLHVEIHIPYAQSLKDKRMVLRRIKDRLQKFNVAVAELEHQDLWQRATSASSPSRTLRCMWNRNSPMPQMKSNASSRG